MTDIVERLREKRIGINQQYPDEDCQEAAALIEHLRVAVESARASAIEECAALMRRWADEAGDDPRNHILRNVSRNASVAISNLASIPSTERPEAK